MGDASLWQSLRDRKDNILDLPPITELVLPQPSITSNLVRHQVSWIVGPPKVGKTVIAHYAAYLLCLGREMSRDFSTIMTFDGGAECARAIDLVIEAPYARDVAVVICENPFGSSAVRPNTIFLRRLHDLTVERPDVTVLATTRPQSYLAYHESIADVPHYRTPLAVSEWYSEDALMRYARLRGEVPFESATVHDLVTPALIDDYVLHQVIPGTASERANLRRKFGTELDDVTLDKVSILQSQPDLKLLAMVMRLQEHAYSLPTTDELSVMSNFEVTGHPHLGLLATQYEFDGLRRLRFEHSTAREAADVLLEESLAGGFLEFRDMQANKPAAAWIGRAIELWSAQREIAGGLWGAFADRREHVRSALVPDTLALGGRNLTTAVSAIDKLSLDAWTVQDLAYEIAANWPDYSKSPEVKNLVARLIESGETHGAYAFLEALLYIRSSDVRGLWQRVDSRLAVLAEGAGEPSEDLLLSVDGLAWRPPPEWRAVGLWAEAFVNKLDRSLDAWGFVRFMLGYHPEGLAYLRRKASDRIDQLVQEDLHHKWTNGQADLALWLVQWHFVHQCRARAQLARQPWVDQQFLCRSFHPATTNYDHDGNAARLIQSLRESGRDQTGWGFFLAENLRAVASTAYGEQTQLESHRSLIDSTPGGKGVLAAVLTYSTDPHLVPAVRSHFQDQDAVRHLMDTLTDGLVVLGTRLVEPRFAYRRNVTGIYSLCGLEWSDLKAAIPREELLDESGKFDVEGLVRRLEEATSSHPMRSDPQLDALMIEVLRRAKQGDLSVLVPGEHRDGRHGGDAYSRLLESSVATLVVG